MNSEKIDFFKRLVFFCVGMGLSLPLLAVEETEQISSCIKRLENLSLKGVKIKQKSWIGIYSSPVYRSKPDPLIEFTVACDTKRESVSQCKARAVQLSKSNFPGRNDIHFIEKANAVGMQAVMTVDGKSITKMFESNGAVSDYMKKLQGQGKDVNLTSLTQINSKENVMILAQSEKPTMEIQVTFGSEVKSFNPSIHLESLFHEVTSQGFELLMMDLGKTGPDGLLPATLQATCAGLATGL